MLGLELEAVATACLYYQATGKAAQERACLPQAHFSGSIQITACLRSLWGR